MPSDKIKEGLVEFFCETIIPWGLIVLKRFYIRIASLYFVGFQGRPPDLSILCNVVFQSPVITNLEMSVSEFTILPRFLMNISCCQFIRSVN